MPLDDTRKDISSKSPGLKRRPKTTTGCNLKTSHEAAAHTSAHDYVQCKQHKGLISMRTIATPGHLSVCCLSITGALSRAQLI